MTCRCKGFRRCAQCRCQSSRTHHAKCRTGRPLCRWRRARPCCCSAYHFPHRKDSGACRLGIPYRIVAEYLNPNRRTT